MSETTLGLSASTESNGALESKRYFFDVSVVKLILMSTVTLTFYQIYWLYKNWQLAKERGDDVMPIARAIFGVLFAYPLFKEVREKGRASGLVLASSAGGLALLYFVLQITWRFPGAAWLLGYLSVVPLALVQRDVARLHSALGLDPNINSRFTWKNWVGLVLGGLFLLLIFIGLFVPEPVPN